MSDNERASIVPQAVDREDAERADELTARSRGLDGFLAGRSKRGGQDASPPHEEAQGLDAEELREIEERLRYLGYID